MDKKDIEKIGIEIKNYHDSNIKKILLLKVGSIIYLNTSSYEYIEYLENIYVKTQIMELHYMI